MFRERHSLIMRNLDGLKDFADKIAGTSLDKLRKSDFETEKSKIETQNAQDDNVNFNK